MPSGIASGFRVRLAGQESEAEIVITAGRPSQHELNRARQRAQAMTEPLTITLDVDKVEFTEEYDRLMAEMEAGSGDDCLGR